MGLRESLIEIDINADVVLKNLDKLHTELIADRSQGHLLQFPGVSRLLEHFGNLAEDSDRFQSLPPEQQDLLRDYAAHSFLLGALTATETNLI